MSAIISDPELVGLLERMRHFLAIDGRYFVDRSEQLSRLKASALRAL